MLKFFFHRFSKVVYTLEIAGVVFTALWLTSHRTLSPGTRTLLGIYFSEYLLLRFMATWRWHRKTGNRYAGIELQFKKCMIPVSYILAVTSGLGWSLGYTFLLWVAVLMFTLLIYVNLTILYLHFRDKNKTPVNYYSRCKK